MACKLYLNKKIKRRKDGYQRNVNLRSSMAYIFSKDFGTRTITTGKEGLQMKKRTNSFKKPYMCMHMRIQLQNN